MIVRLICCACLFTPSNDKRNHYLLTELVFIASPTLFNLKSRDYLRLGCLFSGIINENNENNENNGNNRHKVHAYLDVTLFNSVYSVLYSI
jgi:hypothetical protein